MMKKLSLFAAAAALIGLTACASVSVTPASKLNGEGLTAVKTQPVAHINAYNWGIYCFSIPLLSGEVTDDGIGSIGFMKDTVNVTSEVELLTRTAKKHGATAVTDLQSHNSSLWIMPALVLFYRECEVSGNAVKN